MPSCVKGASHFIGSFLALDGEDSQNENGKPKKRRSYHDLRNVKGRDIRVNVIDPAIRAPLYECGSQVAPLTIMRRFFRAS